MDAYLFPEGCEFYCEDCARDIASEERVENPEGKSVADLMADSCYSNGGGESDTPQHCAGCGVFLDNPLTGDGAEYVAERIAEHVLDPLHGARDVLVEWSESYGDYEGMAKAIGEHILQGFADIPPSETMPVQFAEMWQTDIIENGGLKYRIQALRFGTLYLQRHIFYPSDGSPHLSAPSVENWIDTGLHSGKMTKGGFKPMGARPVIHIPATD